jgi:hypothetical protein
MNKRSFVSVRQDALFSIEKDKEFGEKLVRAIVVAETHHNEVELPSEGFSEAATVTGNDQENKIPGRVLIELLKDSTALLRRFLMVLSEGSLAKDAREHIDRVTHQLENSPDGACRE